MKDTKNFHPQKKDETQRLYFDDPYQFEFSAAVVGRLEHEGRPAIILDRTCFYPEGGGQPSDRGTINGVNVSEVLVRKSRILHVLTQPVPEDQVQARVDSARRFDHMQQHAGQHVLSQAFQELQKAKTLSFHMGEEISTLEIQLPEISDHDLEQVENRANEIVFQDRAIKCYFVVPDKISSVPLRRPPKKTGTIRVVEVSGFDFTACGGTHPRRTGEIGLIKIVGREHIRGNVRFEFLCGWRALHDYGWRTHDMRSLAGRMTVGEKEIGAAVGKLRTENKDLKRRNRVLSEKNAAWEAENIIRHAQGPLLKEIFSEKTADEMRLTALHIIKQGRFCLCFGLKDKERVYLLFARSQDISLDLRDLLPVVSPLIEGKGGGQPSLVQIAGIRTDNLDTALEAAFDFLKKRIQP